VNAFDEYIVVFGPKPHDRQTRVQPLDGSASGAVHSPVHRSGLRVQRFGITKSAPGDLPETFGPYAHATTASSVGGGLVSGAAS
jgi:hypothetical protein